MDVCLSALYGDLRCVPFFGFDIGDHAIGIAYSEHGARHEIQQFKATLVVFALLVVVLSVALVVKGLIK